VTHEKTERHARERKEVLSEIEETFGDMLTIAPAARSSEVVRPEEVPDVADARAVSSEQESIIREAEALREEILADVAVARGSN